MTHTKTFPCYFVLPNGKIAKSTTWWLEARASLSFEHLRNQYQARFPGSKFLLSSAGRTHAQQVLLKKKKPTLAATPGRSWHEAGLAIDCSVSQMWANFGSQAKFEAFMKANGWVRTVARENWHFSPVAICHLFPDVSDAIRYIENNA